MTPLPQLQRIPSRRKNPFKKPAFKRVLFWLVLLAMVGTFGAGLYARYIA